MSDEPRQIIEHLRHLQSITDVLAWVANRFDKATDAYEHQAAIDDVLKELSDYLAKNFDRIDQLLLLILEKLPDDKSSKRIKQQTNNLRKQTIESRIESLKNQLKQQYHNLNWLEEQAAQFGVNVTLEITSQIIRARERIAEIEDEIKYLKEELGKL